MNFNPLQPHLFYTFSKRKQYRLMALHIVAILLLLSCMVILYLYTKSALVFLLFPLYSLPVSFVDTPNGQFSGLLHYYSPLFIVQKNKSGQYNFHGGTLFDYFYCFSWADRGRKANKIVLIAMLEGLLRLIQDLKEEKEPISLSGTSYFFNERTIRRLGFKVSSPNPFTFIIVSIHYVSILISYSFTKGKVKFPPIQKMKKLEIDKNTLINNEARIKEFLIRLGK